VSEEAGITYYWRRKGIDEQRNEGKTVGEGKQIKSYRKKLGET
jgi:hypothetical protein